MATLRIYDKTELGVLVFDLRDLLDLLLPRALDAKWVVSTVKSHKLNREWFEATGKSSEKFEALVQNATPLSGFDLITLAKETQQVIWGEFMGSFSTTPADHWIMIRAVDSTFYEITTLDEAVLDKIKSTYTDIRPVNAPII